MGYRVRKIRLVTKKGRPIRRVTQVRCPNGQRITFTELMPKKLAITQARRLCNV